MFVAFTRQGSSESLIIFKGDRKAAHFLTRFSNVFEKVRAKRTHDSNMNDLSELGH